MNPTNLIASLERFGWLLPDVVSEVSPDDARFKPPDAAWSILEVVCHLADEEVADFRLRLARTLNNPTEPWEPIDPEGWATQRQYNEGRLEDAVSRFTSLRAESVTWLRSLQNPNWSQVHQHPKHGPIRAGDLLASWAAHDYLHLRQIAKRMYQIAARDGGDFSTRYAGEWRA
jgi:DinB superfamily